LAHETFDDSVENQAIIKAFLRQFNEILACFWRIIDKQLNMNVAHCCL
jgi:hypothetical protein